MEIETIKILIELEDNLAKLYALFSKLFEDDSNFWETLSSEEEAHRELLYNLVDMVPEELAKIDLSILKQTNSDIKESIMKYKDFPPAPETALNYAYMIEKSSGEGHYQLLLEEHICSEKTKVFQMLNFADKDHAKRIMSYMNEKV